MKDPRVDTYIAEAAPFAVPLLRSLRASVHAACPEAQETIKWGFPNFMYRGQILCSMAAFKQHVAFGFWNAKYMDDPDGLLESVGKTAMGHLGRITSPADLPPAGVLANYIHRAMWVEKPSAAGQKKTPPQALDIPDDLRDALSASGEAATVFEALAYSHKKEYIQWLTAAKKPETRTRRLEKMMGVLREKKGAK